MVAVLTLAGCVAAEPTSEPDRAVDHLGVQTRLLDLTLVNVGVQLRGAADATAVEDYALCAAVGYARIRGYGFARRVRTNVDEEGGLWRADAVYTISRTLPEGSLTIDAERAVASCAERGIPTV